MRRKISGLIILTLMLGFTTPTAWAAEEGESAGFSVQKLTPAVEEINLSSSFYDLQVSSGQKVTIQAELANHSAVDSQIMQAAYTSSTNDKGEIDYANPLKEVDQDESLTIPFSSIATLKQENPISMKPGERKILSMELQIPDDAADGVILGSWYFEKEDAQSEPEDSGSSMVIDNHFAYDLAVKLTVNQEIAAPNLNFLGITPQLRNQTIKARIQNDQPAVISNLLFKGEITRKGESEVLSSSRLANRMMAPNSSFSIAFPLENQKLTAGEYTLKVDAATTDSKWSNQSWTWAEDFSITPQQIKALETREADHGSVSPNQRYLIVAAVLLAMLAVTGIYLYQKNDSKKVRK